MIIEIIVVVILINLKFDNLIIPFVITAFSVNITSSILLIKYKPKGFIYLILFLIASIAIPIITFFYIINSLHC